ncbi:transposase IS116/IS110/IS902 family protein [Parafrankia sp. EUN1f]|nr:transposase IS116/IS110/IS902 family protein [Parafrankia sp. EUN1f]
MRGAAAVAATEAQRTSPSGERIAALIVADLASQILALDKRITGTDKQIRETFRTHPQPEIIGSMPRIGPIHGGGDRAFYREAGHLASAADLDSVPCASGRRTGNLHRNKRYSHRLRQIFYLSAQTSMIHGRPNRDLYHHKRGECFKHVQAVIALARRRVDVLWALLRYKRIFTAVTPVA